MKFTRCIVALLSLVVLMASCVDESEQLKINTSVEGNAVTICGRITAFDDRLVDTRAGKTTEESYSSSMAMAVFPILEDNESGNKYLADCISYVHLKGSNVNFTVDRSKLRETYGEDYDNKEFALYLFANMPELPATMNELTNKSFDFFMTEAAYINNSGIRRPQKGFPMVGSLGDYVTEGADGNKFVLIPTEGDGENKKIKLPSLNGTPSDYIPIPLKALYAKFSFVINVNPDQHIQNGVDPAFTLESYTLNNIPSSVHAKAGSNNDHTDVLDGSVSATVETTITESGTIEFDFYLPERCLTPNPKASEYLYPLGANGTEVYENAVREEDRCYLQRFKPMLVTQGQKATYITLNGHYKDHQNHDWHVTYDIYLGEDNYSDFNFYRNKNYINNVVIRGLTASNDESVGGAGVFIDHRVNVKRRLPIIINLQRETMLDSHFEVRPLRIRYPGTSLPDGAKVKVEILNSDGTDVNIPTWVRMEHNNGGSETDTHLVSGKRKYFTIDLIDELSEQKDGKFPGKSNTVLIGNPNENETFWLYIDQCNEVALGNPNQMREAMVKVTYNPDTSEEQSMEYKICQHLLYPVQTTRNGEGEDGSTYTYYIEYEEEYLHNFDSEDSYGSTEEAGMEWGLNGIQLSNEYDAFVLSHSVGGDDNFWDNFGDFTGRQNQAFESLNPKPKYDFYLYRDIIDILGEHFQESLLVDGKYADKLKLQDFNGYNLNLSIRDELLSDINKNKPEAKINGITLEELPKSAFAYCYNRNKRNSNGEVVSQDWYLPAIDEIEDIMEFAYGDFDDEFQDNMYWSCQPAYTRTSVELQRYNRPFLQGWKPLAGHIYYGSYFSDDTSHARATKALKENGVFAGVPSSGADASMHRDGIIYIALLATKETQLGDPVGTGVNPYTNHPANKPRVGGKEAKARVRCIRKSEGVTVVEDN